MIRLFLSALWHGPSIEVAETLRSVADRIDDLGYAAGDFCTRAAAKVGRVADEIDPPPPRRWVRPRPEVH